MIYLVGWLGALCKDLVFSGIQDLEQLSSIVHCLRKLNVIETVVFMT